MPGYLILRQGPRSKGDCIDTATQESLPMRSKKKSSPTASSRSGRHALDAVAATPRAVGKRKVVTPTWITIDDTTDDDLDDRRLMPPSTRPRNSLSIREQAALPKPGVPSVVMPDNSKTSNGSRLQEGLHRMQLSASQTRIVELEGQVKTSAWQLANAHAALKERDEQIRQLQSQVNELEDGTLCSICLDRRRDLAFQCGHQACTVCSAGLKECHTCRKKISKRLFLF